MAFDEIQIFVEEKRRDSFSFFFSHFELFQDFNRQLTKRFIANFILRGQ